MVWQIPRLLEFWNGSKCTVCPFHDLGTVCMVTCDRSALWIFDSGYMPRAPDNGVFFDRVLECVCIQMAERQHLVAASCKG